MLCVCLSLWVWEREGRREVVGERWPLDMASHSRLAPTPRDLPSYLAQILAFHLGWNLGELGLCWVFIPPSHTHYTNRNMHTHTLHSRPPPSPGSIFESQMSIALTYKGDNKPHTTLLAPLLSSKHFRFDFFLNSPQEKKKVPPLHYCLLSTNTAYRLKFSHINVF